MDKTLAKFYFKVSELLELKPKTKEYINIKNKMSDVEKSALAKIKAIQSVKKCMSQKSNLRTTTLTQDILTDSLIDNLSNIRDTATHIQDNLTDGLIDHPSKTIDTITHSQDKLTDTITYTQDTLTHNLLDHQTNILDTTTHSQDNLTDAITYIQDN